MKYDVCLTSNEVRVTLSESLVLPEGYRAQLGSSDGQAEFDLVPQIEGLVRQFLRGFVFPPARELK